MTVTPDDIKVAMRLWASGVTVVTTAEGNSRAGTTASSFTSVALTPPLILVCLYHEVETTRLIERHGHFAVSVLAEGQDAVSTQMAGFGDLPPDEDRFYGINWVTKETGSLVYADAAAWFDCRLYAMYEGGTHKIVVGEVVATGRQAEDVPPLLYHNSGYRQMVPGS